MSLILFFPLQIEFYLGDWKFLTMATGVALHQAPMRAFGASTLLGNNGTLPSNGRLTIQLRMAHRQLKITMLPQTKRKFNISNPPLLPTIPLSRVVTDNLHLFLCVSDVLIDLLVEDAMRQDSLKMSKLSNFDRGK